MAVELILSVETEEDLTEAYAWYENRRLGLGEEFLSSVEACLVALCRTPEGHPLVHENYRRTLSAASRMQSFTNTRATRLRSTAYFTLPATHTSGVSACPKPK